MRSKSRQCITHKKHLPIHEYCVGSQIVGYGLDEGAFNLAEVLCEGWRKDLLGESVLRGNDGVVDVALREREGVGFS